MANRMQVPRLPPEDSVCADAAAFGSVVVRIGFEAVPAGGLPAVTRGDDDIAGTGGAHSGVRIPADASVLNVTAGPADASVDGVLRITRSARKVRVSSRSEHHASMYNTPAPLR